ncbi:MAG: alpha/beta hydrolase [Planctomycetales bacterium]|nr:alpha/beta hydrolase [Planctomycetales bacterium]
MPNSLLDHPAISGRYLFPQARRIPQPFVVQVEGAELACHRHVSDPNWPTLVHFHGNGEAVADYVPMFANAYIGLGLNLLLVEYRDYGDSTGEAQLAAMLGDGEAALHAAAVAPERAIVFGRSIGSLYALELARRQPNIAGLVLESGIADPAERFLTYADLEGAGISEEEVQRETRRLFNHQEKLNQYARPLLVLHAEHDSLVEISHAERNFRWAASGRKRLVRLPRGDHNTIFSANIQQYMDELRDFVESVFVPQQ